MRIMAVDEIAEALGIAPGMALADARARLPDLQTTPYDPAGDARWLDFAHYWVLQYTLS